MRFIVFALRGVRPEYLAGGLLLVLLVVLVLALLSIRSSRRDAERHRRD